MMHNGHDLKTAVADSDLLVLSIDAAEGSSLAVSELVHGSLGNVETSASVVDSKDVDGLAVVGETVAGTALRAVPASNALVTTDEREARKAALGGEARSQTVGSVRAGDNVHGAAGVIVTGVVADCEELVFNLWLGFVRVLTSDTRSHAGEAENGSGDGSEELHGEGFGWVW